MYELKFQYVQLQTRYGQSGAGGADRIRSELTETEWLVLDYLGVVSVDGIPNVQATDMSENPARGGGGDVGAGYTRPRNIDNQTTRELAIFYDILYNLRQRI